MHHEPDASQEVMSMLTTSKINLGPTGRFPGGKLTDNDDGEIAFEVGVLKGNVVINFGTQIASLGMSPREARRLAATLIRKANAITKPPLPKKHRRKHHLVPVYR